MTLFSDFVLQWDALSGSGSEFVQVRIEDSNGQKVAGSGSSPGDPGALDGASTSFTIPKNSLVPGGTYQARLFIAHGVSMNTSYATGFGAYIRQTEFLVKTSTTTVMPSVGNPILLPDGRLQFQLQGMADRSYDIEASVNLKADWSTVQTVAIPSNSSTILVTIARSGTHQFFRARQR